MRKFLDSLYLFSGALAAIALFFIVIIVFTQVTFNVIDYLAKHLFDKSFGLLIPSYAQFSGYALGFATFLSLALGLRKAVHIRVTLIETRLPQSVQFVTRVLVLIIGLCIAALFVYSLGSLAYESFLWGDKASGLIKVPLWIPQGVLTFGSFVFFIAMLDTLVEFLLNKQTEALKIDSPEESF